MVLDIDSKINLHSEKTSSISSLSYSIENVLYKGSDKYDISNEIEALKKEGKFPKNLTFIDAHLDEVNGISASAFWDKNTGKVIVGFAGTNLSTSKLHAAKDVIADLKIGFSVRTAEDYYYQSTQQFINKINKKYKISTFTGHSKGGHDAVILGLHNNADNIVVYNSAPVYHNLAPQAAFMMDTERQWDLFWKKGIYLNDKDAGEYYIDLFKENPFISRKLESYYLMKLKNQIKNYKGKITWFISDNDLLNKVNNFTKSTIIGEKIIIDNETGHSMANFLDRDVQAIITEKLMNFDDISFAYPSTHKYIMNTKNNLKSLDQLAIKYSQSGGATTNQKIMLDKVASSILVAGYRQIIDERITKIKSTYKEYIEKYSIIWQGTYENAHLIGDYISDYEILEALERGGATKESIAMLPSRKIEEKILKLNKYKKECEEVMDKINESIQEMLKKDETLAQDFGVFL
ncbi:hypothetical protein [Macrococcus capreoli]|uniref:hypothetical protein n=1 Tax=Macrococcus capreoli TaxID=2982690 RepID=UPI003F4347D5